MGGDVNRESSCTVEPIDETLEKTRRDMLANQYWKAERLFKVRQDQLERGRPSDRCSDCHQVRFAMLLAFNLGDRGRERASDKWLAPFHYLHASHRLDRFDKLLCGLVKARVTFTEWFLQYGH